MKHNVVRTVICKMRKNKAPGPDGIPVEAYEASQAAADKLTRLLPQICEKEKMPSALALGTIVMIHTKGSKNDRKNQRAICLLSHAFKIFSMCLSTACSLSLSAFCSTHKQAFDRHADAEITHAS